jgi:hypothetical protein
VELSAPSPTQPDWRRATIIAGGVAAFELVLLLIVGIALIGKPLAAHAKDSAITHATGGSIAPLKLEPKNTTLSRGETSILVLNANGIAGAAAEAASRVRARGYTVAATGNAARSYGRSVVMYRPGRRPEAQRLAHEIGIRLVGPLDGMGPRQLKGAQVVLVLGT